MLIDVKLFKIPCLQEGYVKFRILFGILCWPVSRKGVYHELNIYNSQEMIIQIGIDVVEWIYQLEGR